jgi:ankyrin repeat protein
VTKIIEENKKSVQEWNLQNGKYNAPIDIKWLVDAQCDIYWTPIMFAARYGHVDIVKYLISQNAMIEHSSNYYNALHTACFGQSIETVRFLINEKGVDVNPQTLEKTPLYIAT